MIFILFLYFSALSPDGGMALTTAEFESHAACESAAKNAKRMADRYAIAKHTCEPKGGQ